MKKKLVNFRPIFLIAITLIVATFFATKVFVAQGLKLAFFILLIVLALGCFGVRFFKKSKLIVVVGCCFLCASYPFLNVFIKGEKLEKYQNLDQTTVSVTGVVDGAYKIKNGSISFKLKNVEVFDFNTTTELSGKLTVYLSPDNFVPEKDFASGTLLNFLARLDMLSCQDENLKRAYSFLSSDIVGIAFAQESTVKNLGCYPNLRDNIQSFVANKLKALDLKHSDIAMALLFGDTSNIDNETYDEFKITGIAHLLAVSGLHVSVIMALVAFVLKKCKVSPYFNLFISFVMLSIYCYICGFAASIIRASIMAVFGGYAISRGKPYDRLSSVSFASLVTMLYAPILLFNLSFQLSYVAVLAMCCLSPALERIFGKKLEKGLTSSLAVDIAIDVGIIAIMCHYFGRFSLLSIPANLVLIPISSVAFVLLIVGTVLTLIFPFMSFLIGGYDAIMHIVVQFNSWIAGLGLTINLSVSALVVILSLVLIWVLSDYLFATKKTKGILASIASLCVCLLLFI